MDLVQGILSAYDVDLSYSDGTKQPVIVLLLLTDAIRQYIYIFLSGGYTSSQVFLSILYQSNSWWNFRDSIFQMFNIVSFQSII